VQLDSFGCYARGSSLTHTGSRPLTHLQRSPQPGDKGDASSGPSPPLVRSLNLRIQHPLVQHPGRGDAEAEQHPTLRMPHICTPPSSNHPACTRNLSRNRFNTGVKGRRSVEGQGGRVHPLAACEVAWQRPVVGFSSRFKPGAANCSLDLSQLWPAAS
jgi:hypothetical protein